MLFLADIVFNLDIHFLLQQICSIILEAKEEKGLSERERRCFMALHKTWQRVYFFLLSNARLTSRLPPISPAPKSLTTGAATVQGRRKRFGDSSPQILADQSTLFQPGPCRERAYYCLYPRIFRPSYSPD